MAITLGKSLAAGNALRALDRGGGALQGIFERLASGQRINRAADDAAGLAVASGLNVRSRVYDQGIRNFNDGVSLLNVADGALEELTNIVTRIKELAVQSSNGVFSDTQRQSLDIEAQALADEFTRIVQSTSFNGRGLFNGELENGLTLQGGLGEAAAIFSSLGKDLGTGDFQADLSFSSSYGTTIVDVGDLNGDGILDMVSGGTNGISILIGSGDGTFTEIATGTLTTGSRTYRDIRLEDINGDGVLDITAVADRASVAYFSTALGNGDGTFEGLQESASASAQVYYDLNFADVNGDGIQDAIASGSRSGGSATFDIRLGNGDGTFQVAVSNPGSDFAIFESLILGNL